MQRRRYPSYLLRMWRVGPDPGEWRAILENPATGERHGFARPEDLCAWLQAQAESGEPGEPSIFVPDVDRQNPEVDS